MIMVNGTFGCPDGGAASLPVPLPRFGRQSRFLILDFGGIPGVEVWQIGNEGGFLAAPVNLTAHGNRLLMALAAGPT